MRALTIPWYISKYFTLERPHCRVASCTDISLVHTYFVQKLIATRQQIYMKRAIKMCVGIESYKSLYSRAIVTYMTYICAARSSRQCLKIFNLLSTVVCYWCSACKDVTAAMQFYYKFLRPTRIIMHPGRQQFNTIGMKKSTFCLLFLLNENIQGWWSAKDKREYIFLYEKVKFYDFNCYWKVNWILRRKKYCG